MSVWRIATRAGNTNRQLLMTRRMVAYYPPYEAKKKEEESVKRKRLLYQSRKRGITENGILLSTFADRYLDSFTTDQLHQYDSLLNHPDNDWDIYYWVTGREATPSYHDNSVMELLKKHTQNTNREMRFNQPEFK